MSRLRWKIGNWINDHIGIPARWLIVRRLRLDEKPLCWSNVVTWAQGMDDEFPTKALCESDAKRDGQCYCGRVCRLHDGDLAEIRRRILPPMQEVR